MKKKVGNSMGQEEKYMDEYIKEISEKIEDKKEYYAKISDKIWEYAEPRFQEYKSSELLQQTLKKEGFSIKSNLAADLDAYPHHKLEQGYLSTAPVVRIRKEDDNYYLTYKSKGLMTREEYNLPLTKESYEHMRPKADGILISKTRYLIPEKDGLTIELDVFDAPYEGLYLAEVEFSSEEQALSYNPPVWFGEDVTNSGKYHNSRLSQGNL